MTDSWTNIVFMVLQFAITLGMFVLSILLFWHLKRIGKLVLAGIFWCVMMLTALMPFFQIIQSSVPLMHIPLHFIAISAVAPIIIIVILYFNPLRPIVFDDEDFTDDDNEPFEIPDQV